MPQQDGSAGNTAKEAVMKRKNGKIDIVFYAKKALFIILGMIIMCQGVDMYIMTGIGVDPVSVFVEGLSKQLGVSFGMSQSIINFTLVIFILIFFRKYIGLTTICAMICLGPFFDLFLNLESAFITPEISIVMKIFWVAIGQLLFSFGLALYLTPDTGGSPCDTPSVIISKAFNIKYGTIRVFSDLTFLITGFFLGGTVGVGTIIAAFSTGPLSQLFRKKDKELMDKFLKEQ